MKSYIKLLSQNYTLKRLSFVQLISYFGAWFSNVAIYTLLIKLNVDAKVIGFVASLHFLAGVIQAPFSGAVIDKFHPKRLLLMLLFIEAVSTFLLIFIDSTDKLDFLYILIFVKMASASFYFTTEMSLLPKILDGKDLQRANEIHSIIWSFSYTVGMAVSGYIVYIFGVKTAFLIDSCLFVVSFFILYGLKIDISVKKATSNLFKMIKEAFFYLGRDKKVLHLILIHSFVGFTAFDALVALMVDNYYAGIVATSLSLGLLHSFRAFGLVIGPIFLGKWINKKNLVLLFIFEALAIMVWAISMKNFYLSLVVSILVGFFTTTLWSYTYTILQKNTKKEFYGRVVAYNDMAFLGLSAFVSYMIGVLYKTGFSLEGIAFVMAGAFVVGSFYQAYIVRRYDIKEV